LLGPNDKGLVALDRAVQRDLSIEGCTSQRFAAGAIRHHLHDRDELFRRPFFGKRAAKVLAQYAVATFATLGKILDWWP